ncbi:MAG TPA: hypothetical protein VHY79_14145 [Rhizomicrobium sp.]|nr:hypothetical protein [Rhizomicrobium sp.]
MEGETSEVAASAAPGGAASTGIALALAAHGREMRKNRSDRALAKFEEANKFAPNWGRLHLEWGEALADVGRKGEAQKRFAIASRLDLSPPDKPALTRWMNRHG